MDTGLGAKAYSIIEQGKIGQILSSKPTDRRAIIEEAAGITKYKVRRRQTQLKLEAAQQNLLRVNDIVNEVEKQLESLKRQAAKARRWPQTVLFSPSSETATRTMSIVAGATGWTIGVVTDAAVDTIALD